MPRRRFPSWPAGALVLLFAVALLPGVILSPSWRTEGSHSDAELGSSVSVGDVNGDDYADVIVGEPRYANGTIREGSVRVFYGSAAGLPLVPSWSRESDLLTAEFGRSVAAAGDVDDDGYGDIIVGAPFANARGEVFLFAGSSSGLQTDPVWTAFLGQNYSNFGASVAGAGDLNGDGFADVIVGAPSFSNSIAQGAAFVYHGSPAGLSTLPDWTTYGPRSYYSGVGTAVAAAGDVNGDGYDDVILGVNQFTNGQMNEGGAFVYLGSATGLAATPAWSVESNQADQRLALAVAGGGDVNGDGFSDVAVAAPLFDGTLENEGIVHVYHGSPLGLNATPAFSVKGAQLNILFGQAVDVRNDMNGDGYADLVVGAIWQQVNQHIRGAARVYYGSPSGLGTGGPNIDGSDTVMGPQDGGEFGGSVSLAGDIDADGFADLVVGAPQHDDDAAGQSGNGLAQIHPGSGSTRDRDGDGTTPAGGDCDERDSQVWARPLEVANIQFLDSETLVWEGQLSPDGQQVRYDVLRSGSPIDFVSAIECVQSDAVVTQAIDASGPPNPTTVYYYLVRAENGCPGVTGRGPMGANSAGFPRSARSCP